MPHAAEHATPLDDALQGVRVLDLTGLLPGPFCTQLLADLGAEVIKLEAPSGDLARLAPPIEPDGLSAFFKALNRGKQSVALDLKRPGALKALLELVATSDVLVEAFRPGVLKRLGLGAEALQRARPDLIVCAITGYGQRGPYAERAGHDLNYQALSGALSAAQGFGVPGVQVADLAGGALYAALGITTSLFRRERTGRGARLDVSMAHGALSLHAGLHAQQRAEPRSPHDLLTGGAPCYALYRAGDGRFMALGALEPKFWLEFLRVAGLTEALDGSDAFARGARGEQVRAILAERFASSAQAEWVELLRDVDACCEPLLSPAEALEHALHTSREAFLQQQGEEAPCTHTLAAFGVTPSPAARLAPQLGEHTERVLGQILSRDELEALRRHGAI